MKTENDYDEIDVYGTEQGVNLEVRNADDKLEFSLTLQEARSLIDMTISAIEYHYKKQLKK